MRARLHYAALHRRQHELRELASIEAFGQAQVGLKQALFHGIDPGFEVVGERLAHQWVGLVDLQRQRAEGRPETFLSRPGASALTGTSASLRLDASKEALMIYLILGLVIFLGVHSVRIVADDWRSARIARLGEGPWKGLYSLVSLAGFALIVWGYGQARLDPVVLWSPPGWTRHLLPPLTLLTFVLVAAAYVPGAHLKAWLGSPMVLGVKLWAFAHLIANGTLAGTVLFGSFLVWAVVDFASSRRRDRAAGVTYAAGSLTRDALAAVIGVAAWAAFAFWLHGWLFGVRPFG